MQVVNAYSKPYTHVNLLNDSLLLIWRWIDHLRCWPTFIMFLLKSSTDGGPFFWFPHVLPPYFSLSPALFFMHSPFMLLVHLKPNFNSKSIFSAKLVFLWSYGVVCLLCYCRCSEMLYVVLRVWTMLFLEYRETGVAYSLFRSCVYVCEFPISCLLLHTFVTLRFSDVQYFSMYAMHLFRVLTYGMSLYLL